MLDCQFCFIAGTPFCYGYDGFFAELSFLLCCFSEKELISMAIDWTADGTAYSPGNRPAKGSSARRALYSFNIIVRGGAFQSVRFAISSATVMT